MGTQQSLQCRLSSQGFVAMGEGANSYNYGNLSNEEPMCTLSEHYSSSEPMANHIPIAWKTLRDLRRII